MVKLAHAAALAALAFTNLASGNVINAVVAREDDSDVEWTQSVDFSNETTPVQVLVPIPNEGSGNSKRDLKEKLQLKKEETFKWGLPGDKNEDGMVAKFKVEMPGDDEGIVDMETFRDAVTDLKCNEKNGNLKFNFKEEYDFDSAKDVWDWVNIEDRRHFFLVVGPRDCGWNEDRQTFKVKNIKYNEERKRQFTLVADPIDWEKLAHSYDLEMGNVPEDHEDMVKLRRGLGDWGYGKEVSPSIARSFPIGLSFKMNGITVKAECSDCKTTGKFKIAFKQKMKWLKVKESWLKIEPKDVGLEASLKLGLSADLTSKLAEKKIELFKVALAGISIPKIITLGPTLTVKAGFEIAEVKGGADVTFGGSVKIPDTALVYVDFKDSKKSKTTSWKPVVKSNPMKVSAKLEARALVYVGPEVAMEINVLGSGIAGKFGAKMPYFDAKLALLESPTCTVCDKYALGIEGSLNLGAEMAFKATKMVNNKESALWEVKLFSVAFPKLASFCFGVFECNNPLSRVKARMVLGENSPMPRI